MIATLSVLFFVSGACALVYQVLWLRLMGLVFGVTIHAASTVLAVFMGGLAAGSVLAGRLGPRTARPLRWFGMAEAGIGLSAALSPLVVSWLQTAYVSLYPGLPDAPATVTVARFLIAALALALPTLLMGATLPLVLRSSFVRDRTAGEGELSRRLALLYASNTAGAITGTLLSGLLLIPRAGISRTFALAAAANGLVALGAFALDALARRSAPARLDRPVHTSNEVAARAASLPDGVPGSHGADSKARVRPDDVLDLSPPPSGGVRVAVLALFAVSGFVSLALEVAWFRASILLIRPTVYAFGVMLATVLGGIALGSALASRLPRLWHDRVVLLVALELLIAAAAALSPWGLVAAPDAARFTQPWLERLMPAYLPFLVTASVLTIAPTAILLGAAFPVGAALWTGTARPDEAGSRVGVFYALNVCGGILGSLAAGFFLLPALGTGDTIAVLSIIVAVSVCPVALLHPRRAAVVLAATGVPAIVVAAVLAPDPTRALLEHRYRGETILWLEEGKQSTVSVHAADGGRRSLYVDGAHQASTAGAMPFVHQRIGHLAMALHPEPRTALVVGLGGGATAGAVSLHPGVEVDVVELSESVVRAASYFREINFDLLQRPNVRVRVDDGRNFLMLARRTAQKKYDVITADVILPIHAGATNLYSAEYFRLVHDALDEDGVALQWVAGTKEEFRLIVRTFMSVFPETTLWADGTLMVGTKRPLQLRRGDFEWRLGIPPLDTELPRFGLGSFPDLLGQFLGGTEELRQLVGPGPLLTDDRPLVEYFLALPRDAEIDLSPLRRDARRYLANDQ